MKLNMRFLVSAAAAVGIMAQGAAAAEPEKPEVNISVFTGSLVTLIERITVNQGFLEKEGIKGNLVEATNGPAMLAAVLGASSDFTAASPIFTWDLHGKGECLTYMGNGVGGFYSLIARADVDMPNASKGFPDSIRDLKGKRIGVVGRGTATEQFTAMVLRDAGLDPNKDVTFVATGGLATIVPALENKMVDAQLAFPPLDFKLPAGSFKPIANLFSGDIQTLKGMMQVGPITSCAFKKANPETYSRYCKAYHNAYNFALDPQNGEAVASEIAKAFGVPADTAAAIWKEYRGAFPGPQMTPEIWNAQSKFITKDGQPVPAPPYADMVDDQCGKA